MCVRKAEKMVRWWTGSGVWISETDCDSSLQGIRCVVVGRGVMRSDWWVEGRVLVLAVMCARVMCSNVAAEPLRERVLVVC